MTTVSQHEQTNDFSLTINVLSQHNVIAVNVGHELTVHRLFTYLVMSSKLATTAAQPCCCKCWS